MHASLEGTGDLKSVLDRIDAFGHDWIHTHATGCSSSSLAPPSSPSSPYDEQEEGGEENGCGGDGTYHTLLDALDHLLRYRVPPSSSSSAEAAACVHLWEGCPLSVARVRLNRKALGPLRYNLFKRVLDRGIRWRPSVVYFFENDDDEEETQERYRYFLQHTLRDCKTVRIPAHWSPENKARVVVEDARRLLMTTCSSALS